MPSPDPKSRKTKLNRLVWVRSRRWLPIFWEALEEFGVISAACKVAGIDHEVINRQRKLDKAFDRQVWDTINRCEHRIYQTVIVPNLPSVLRGKLKHETPPREQGSD